MWYWLATPISYYDLTDAQYCWVETWVSNHESSYPYP
jgi:hypothetical protein